MMNIDQVSAQKFYSPRSNSKVIPLLFILDMTGSMLSMMASGLTRYESVIPVLIAWLRSMCNNEMLLDNLCVTIRGFNSVETTTFVEEQFLGDIDIDALEAKLRSAQCRGSTPLGECLCRELDFLQASKEAMDRVGTARFQPLLALVSDDDEAGMDDVQDAVARIDSLLAQDKLVFLPVGIGDPGTSFPNMTRMLKNGPDCKCSVISSQDDLTRYFRFLGQSVLAVSAGKYRVMSYSDFGKGFAR